MIDQSTIMRYGPDTSLQKSESIVESARARGEQTAFLSHSHTDAALAKRIQSFLKDQGWHVYIDWEDAAMPNKPSKETASNIKARIKRFDWFLFLATQNSMASRWCPWEIGFADGIKPHERIIVLPTKDRVGTTHGNEYLDLYRHLDKSFTYGAVVRDAGRLAGGTPLKEMRR